MSKTVQFDQIVLPHEQFKALQMDIANEMFEAVYSDRTDEQYIRDKAGNLSLTETAQDCFNSLFDAAVEWLACNLLCHLCNVHGRGILKRTDRKLPAITLG